MAEKSKGSKKARRVVATSRTALSCVGNVCFNPDTGVVDVELRRDSCPPATIKKIVESMVKGVRVNIVLPPVKKED